MPIQVVAFRSVLEELADHKVTLIPKLHPAVVAAAAVSADFGKQATGKTQRSD